MTAEAFASAAPVTPTAATRVRSAASRDRAERGVDVARHALDLADAARARFHRARARRDARRHDAGHLHDVVRRLLRLLGELAHFVGDDGETAARVAGARGFDRRVEREQVRLIGDLPDRRARSD